LTIDLLDWMANLPGSSLYSSGLRELIRVVIVLKWITWLGGEATFSWSGWSWGQSQTVLR